MTWYSRASYERRGSNAYATQHDRHGRFVKLYANCGSTPLRRSSEGTSSGGSDAFKAWRVHTGRCAKHLASSR